MNEDLDFGNKEKVIVNVVDTSESVYLNFILFT